MSRPYDTVVQLLLKEGAKDVNFTSEDRSTPLHFAVGEGHGATAQLLLSNSADVRAKTTRGATPLHLAAGKMSSAVVLLLLQNGADPNATSTNGDPPLHAALKAGRLGSGGADAAKTVQTLLEHGAEIDARGYDRETALEVALNFRVDSAIIEMLLERGADPNALKHVNWNSLLHSAAEQKDLALMRKLLEMGAAVNPKPFTLHPYPKP